VLQLACRYNHSPCQLDVKQRQDRNSKGHQQHCSWQTTACSHCELLHTLPVALVASDRHPNCFDGPCVGINHDTYLLSAS
jgi:hypothetical protein